MAFFDGGGCSSLPESSKISMFWLWKGMEFWEYLVAMVGSFQFVGIARNERPKIGEVCANLFLNNCINKYFKHTYLCNFREFLTSVVLQHVLVLHEFLLFQDKV